jgi:hypothetical protein
MTSDTRDSVTIVLPRELALKLLKYTECYAPVLREVAKACASSLKQEND